MVQNLLSQFMVLQSHVIDTSLNSSYTVHMTNLTRYLHDEVTNIQGSKQDSRLRIVYID